MASLVAYLGSPKQVPMLATDENVGTFFNGRDLTGWVGDADLWSVENGEFAVSTNEHGSTIPVSNIRSSI